MSAIDASTSSTGTPRGRVLLADVAGRFGDWGARALAELRRRGSRATPAKLAVLASLSGLRVAGQGPDQPIVTAYAAHRSAAHALPSHFTTAEIILATSALEIELDEGTIYRTLERLVQLDLVHRVTLHERPALYGLDMPAHHHAICSGCGRVTPIAQRNLLTLAAEAAHIADLAVPASGGLTLHGYCSTCRVDRQHPVSG